MHSECVLIHVDTMVGSDAEKQPAINDVHLPNVHLNVVKHT